MTMASVLSTLHNFKSYLSTMLLGSTYLVGSILKFIKDRIAALLLVEARKFNYIANNSYKTLTSTIDWNFFYFQRFN